MKANSLRNHLAIITGLFIAVAGAQVVKADTTTTYNIDFNTNNGTPPAPTAGSFTYDSTTQTFSDFTVNWDGQMFDLTGGANNPDISGTVPCLDGKTGAAASFALLDGACNPPDPTFFTDWTGGILFDSVFGFATEDGGSNSITVNSNALAESSIVPFFSGGGWTITAEVAAVPEPSSLIPITLLGLFAARKRIAQGLRRAARLT